MRCFVVGLIVLASFAAVAQIDPMCEKMLPASAVGKAAKLSIHLIPPDPRKGAGDVKSYRKVVGGQTANEIFGRLFPRGIRSSSLAKAMS